jgi:hypothetical protein
MYGRPLKAREVHLPSSVHGKNEYDGDYRKGGDDLERPYLSIIPFLGRDPAIVGASVPRAGIVGLSPLDGEILGWMVGKGTYGDR